jgi:hypothetical protein
MIQKMPTKYNATTTKDYYFSSTRNDAALENELKAVILNLF